MSTEAPSSLVLFPGCLVLFISRQASPSQLSPVTPPCPKSLLVISSGVNESSLALRVTDKSCHIVVQTGKSQEEDLEGVVRDLQKRLVNVLENE